MIRRRRRLYLATWGTNARLVQAYSRPDVEFALPGHNVRPATDADVEVFRQVVAFALPGHNVRPATDADVEVFRQVVAS